MSAIHHTNDDRRRLHDGPGVSDKIIGPSKMIPPAQSERFIHIADSIQCFGLCYARIWIRNLWQLYISELAIVHTHFPRLGWENVKWENWSWCTRWKLRGWWVVAADVRIRDCVRVFVYEICFIFSIGCVCWCWCICFGRNAWLWALPSIKEISESVFVLCIACRMFV